MLGAAALLVAGCSTMDGGGGDGLGPVCTDCMPTVPMKLLLPSQNGVKLWTAPTMEKVLREAPLPMSLSSSIQLYAAKNEYEAFQFVVRPDARETVSITMSALTGPGTIPLANIEIRRVGYVQVAVPSDDSAIVSAAGIIPDPLELTSFGMPDTLTGNINQPYWITVRVPPDASAGDYTATLNVTSGSGSQDIPIKLHVYNFALPAQIGFDGDWNASFAALGGNSSPQAAQQLKDFFFAHRLTPSAVAYPAGLNYDGGIMYDCNGNFQENKSDPNDFSNLGIKYIDGVGWNGAGFPSFQIMQYVDAKTPRPDTFCGVPRGPDAYGTPAYNAKWTQLLSTINGYLGTHGGYQKKGYYYVQSQPQGQADYDLAAYLANLTKTAAPNLRIAIGEEPKAEIAENAKAMGHSWDLWFGSPAQFEPNYAKTRQQKGETLFWSFLPSDAPPVFNPITLDHPGIESRVAFWAAWKYRIKGFAYYSVTGWGADPYNNPRPSGSSQNGDGFLLYPMKSGNLVTSIRWELLREGAEDFEYLLLASANGLPQTPDTAALVDTSVQSAVTSLSMYVKNPDALQNLRNQLGLRIEGKVNGYPTLSSSQ